MIKGRESDTFNVTRLHLESMLSKSNDKSATDLFKTFFCGVIVPEFSKSYGIDLKYTKDYSKLIDELDMIHESLTVNNL
jgi:hypothetical protein